jgi:hypothetical protein
LKARVALALTDAEARTDSTALPGLRAWFQTFNAFPTAWRRVRRTGEDVEQALRDAPSHRSSIDFVGSFDAVAAECGDATRVADGRRHGACSTAGWCRARDYHGACLARCRELYLERAVTSPW